MWIVYSLIILAASRCIQAEIDDVEKNNGNYRRPCSVVVTGGSGFVGRALLHSFPSSFLRHITVLGRNKPADLNHLQFEFLDLSELLNSTTFPQTAAEVLRTADIVVHAAAILNFFPNTQNLDSRMYSDEELMSYVNVNSTSAILNEINPSSTFIYTSSTEAMGECTLCSEDAPVSPWCAYGQTKLVAEHNIRQSSRHYMILRLTGLFGPYEMFSGYQLISAVNMGLLPFSVKGPSAHLMYSHIDDAVQAIRLAMLLAGTQSRCAIPNSMMPSRWRNQENMMPFYTLPIGNNPLDTFRKHMIQWPTVTVLESAINQTYIIAPDSSARVVDWVSVIASHLHRPSPFLSLPPSIVAFAMTLLDPILNPMFSNPFLFKAKIVNRMLENRTYMNTKAKNLMLFYPLYEPNDMISETVSWYLDQGWLNASAISAFEIVLATSFAVLIILYHMCCPCRRKMKLT